MKNRAITLVCMTNNKNDLKFFYVKKHPQVNKKRINLFYIFMLCLFAIMLGNVDFNPSSFNFFFSFTFHTPRFSSYESKNSSPLSSLSVSIGVHYSFFFIGTEVSSNISFTVSPICIRIICEKGLWSFISENVILQI